jgi:phosphohistidine phosphatase
MGMRVAMRHLFLLRHGKSAWPEGVADHDRPLAPRGQSAVPLIGQRLKAIQPHFDRVLVSDARRTRETFARLQTVMPDLQPIIEPAIYEATPARLFRLVQDLPDEAETVLMIGHNPGFHALALYLAGAEGGDGEAYRRLERKLPTAGLIHIALASGWGGIDQATGQLMHFITPAMVGGIDED